jgi:hypothetical protein
VDIYIEDRRPSAETTERWTVEHGPGTYVPVSLDWGRYAEPPPAAAGIPRWFARGTAIENQGGQIFVTVGNRGRETATGVTVSVSSRAWPAGSDPPEWGAGPWTPSPSPPAQDIPPSETRRFGGFDLGAVTGRRLLLAQATCEDDRANTDPLTLFPCSYLPTPLPDLVASDNNLGVIVIR